MAILLPPSVIEKAASRFKKVAILSEQAELESHILNFYEDFNMPMSDLYELIDTIQMGELQEIQEKMDGQNITFTVMDGSLLFFSKGATYKRVLSGAGMDRAGIIEKYSWNDSVRNAFVKAYDALSPVSLQFQDSLFQNGKVLVESALLTPENPNTIVYDEPSIRFIQAAAVAPDTVVDDEAFNEFVSSAEAGANQDFHMGSVPYLRLLRALDITDEETGEIKSSIDSLLSQYNLSQENTMGELVHSMVREKLGDSVPEQLLDAATAKIATGRGSIARAFKKIDPEGWDSFNNNILKRRATFLADAIIPIENIVQRIGILVIRNIDFTLKASNRDDLSRFISSARVAFDGNHIIANPKELEGIRVALARIQANEELFEKATEGIVFKWKDGKTRKLTGMFTPINKLRGFFAYGGAQIQERGDVTDNISERVEKAWERMLLEGGNAFKDDQGNIVTSQGRIPRSEVQPIVSNFTRDVLDPLGLEHIGVGTTVTDTPDVGDIDIVVTAENAKDVKLRLSEHPELLSELPEAPGVNRLYMLPGGAGVAVLYKVPATGQLVQVDVMPSKGVSLDDISWMLSGASAGGVKSRYRNILLSFIANRLSEKESAETGLNVKYTYARGLMKKVDGAALGPRETDPDAFLPLLGIDTPKEAVSSFEGLVAVMRDDPWLSSTLPGFRAYIDNRGHIMSNDPVRSAEANAAADYIDKDTLDESFRSVIRSLLNEGRQMTLFNPERIDYRWLDANSVEDPLYDHTAKRLYPAGYAALLKGMTSEDAGRERVEGEKFEHGIIEYAKEIGAGGLKRVGGEGEDLEGLTGAVQGRTYELKKTKQSSPNLKLNSSFPKGESDHYYMFVVNLPMIAEMKVGMQDLARTGKDFETFEGELDQLNDFVQEINYFSKSLNGPTRDALVRRTKDRLLVASRQELLPLEDEEGAVVSEQTDVQNVDNVARFIDLLDKIGKKNYDNYGSTDSERLEIIESLEHNGKVSGAALKRQITKKLDGTKSVTQLQKELTRVFRNILGDLRCWIVPSIVLRTDILASAFPGREGEIFNRETGDLLPGGKEKISDALREKLANLDIAAKIAEKISPTVVDQVEGEKASRKEAEWDVRLGLLKVRIKIQIEPPAAKGDD